MKAFIRRLRRLEEERFGTAADSEFTQRLRERIEAGRRRVAEAQERGELGPPDRGPYFEARHRQYMEAMARLWREGKMRRNRGR